MNEHSDTVNDGGDTQGRIEGEVMPDELAPAVRNINQRIAGPDAMSSDASQTFLGCLILLGGMLFVVLAVVWLFHAIFPKHKASPNLIAETSSSLNAPNTQPESSSIQGREGLSDTTLIVMAEDAVRERLTDPDSAKFTDVFVSRRSGTAVVCGTVNAKNRMGGYAGKESFVTNGLAKYTFMASEISDFPVAWKQFCSR